MAGCTRDHLARAQCFLAICERTVNGGSPQSARPSIVRFRFPLGNRWLSVYTDAQGKGHAAAVLVGMGAAGTQVCHTHIPPWMACARLGIGIGEYDMFAVALGVIWDVALFPDRPILV